MRSRRPSPEHQEAVTRRLALLSAELATVRPSAEEGREHTRIRAVPEPADEVTVVPVPGRHARAGMRASLGDLVPETLRGRVGVGPGAVTVVAIVLCAGLALTCWWLVRSDPQEVVATEAAVPLVAAVSQQPPAPPSSPGAAPSGATGEVTVDVAGTVRRPGIAVLPAGSRVVDAVAAAGGARRGTDLTSINLARPLVDGEQVLVGLPVVAGPAATEPGTTATGVLVNLNTADQVTLETLPGVGPVTAGAILGWRAEHGGFTSVDELLEVDGIGDATLAQLAPLVTI